MVFFPDLFTPMPGTLVGASCSRSWSWELEAPATLGTLALGFMALIYYDVPAN